MAEFLHLVHWSLWAQKWSVSFIRKNSPSSLIRPPKIKAYMETHFKTCSKNLVKSFNFTIKTEIANKQKYAPFIMKTCIQKLNKQVFFYPAQGNCSKDWPMRLLKCEIGKHKCGEKCKPTWDSRVCLPLGKVNFMFWMAQDLKDHPKSPQRLLISLLSHIVIYKLLENVFYDTECPMRPCAINFIFMG